MLRALTRLVFTHALAEEAVLKAAHSQHADAHLGGRDEADRRAYRVGASGADPAAIFSTAGCGKQYVIQRVITYVSVGCPTAVDHRLGRRAHHGC
jgi:hypothetical protein